MTRQSLLCIPLLLLFKVFHISPLFSNLPQSLHHLLVADLASNFIEKIGQIKEVVLNSAPSKSTSLFVHASIFSVFSQHPVEMPVSLKGTLSTCTSDSILSLSQGFCSYIIFSSLFCINNSLPFWIIPVSIHSLYLSKKKKDTKTKSSLTSHSPYYIFLLLFTIKFLKYPSVSTM